MSEIEKKNMKFLCFRFINILFIEIREVFQYILSPLKVMYKYTLIYLAVFGGMQCFMVRFGVLIHTDTGSQVHYLTNPPHGRVRWLLKTLGRSASQPSFNGQPLPSLQ